MEKLVVMITKYRPAMSQRVPESKPTRASSYYLTLP